MILGADGLPYENSSLMENPNFDLNDVAAWEELGMISKTTAGVRISRANTMGYPPLWRAINLISNDVARLPLIRYTRLSDNGKEVDRKGSSYKMMRKKTNPLIRASVFKKTLTYHALYHGNGFAAIFRDQTLTAREMLILDPCQTVMKVYEDQMMYGTYIDGELVKIPPRDIFHIKGLSHNGLWGFNVIELMSEALGLGIAAREFGSRFFGQGSNQSGVLMVPANFTEDKIRSTLKMWNDVATGMAKSHKVALLKENVKFVPTSISPNQGQFNETRQFEIREVSNITGVPPHKLGDSSRAGYNSLESENQAYIDDTLDPWLVEWEEECDDKLLTTKEQDEETHFHEFNRNARMRMDATARAGFYKALTEIGVTSPNDIARRENMPTMGPMGDQRFRPANWVPLDSPAPAAAVRPAPANVRNAIQKVLEKKSNVEKDRLAKLAKENKLNSDALTDFYRQHENHVWEALQTVAIVTNADELRWKSCLAASGTRKQDYLLTQGLKDAEQFFADDNTQLITNLLEAI